MEFEEALRILAAFDREGVRYVLVGSMAMAAQGVIRATRDIDFFVAPDADNVTRLRRALQSVFEGDESIQEITADDLGGDYPAIQYTPPHALYTIDLLSRLGDRFTFDDIESETLSIEGVPVVVATPQMLYRMKRDTVRPQDHADAETLRQLFELEEND